MRAILFAFLVATTARGADPVYEAPTPAPDVEGGLVWRSNGVDVHGIWATDAAVRRLQLKLEERQATIDFLTDKATKECVAATNAETRKILGATPTLWVGVGIALAVGVAGGFYLGRR
jgi:hypothetical protein